MSVDHRKKLAATVRKAAREAERKYKQLHPEAAQLGVLATVAAYKRRPKGSDFRVRAVMLMVGSRFASQMTNQEVAARLGESYPGYKVPPNILTERFTPAEKARVAALLGEQGFSIDVNTFDTPSKVKRALIASQSAEQATAQFVGRVSFTDDAVVVDDTRYPIQQNGKYPRIHVGKAMLNVDGLKALLS